MEAQEREGEQGGMSIRAWFERLIQCVKNRRAQSGKMYDAQRDQKMELSTTDPPMILTVSFGRQTGGYASGGFPLSDKRPAGQGHLESNERRFTQTSDLRVSYGTPNFQDEGSGSMS